jgi:hypothetical protein
MMMCPHCGRAHAGVPIAGGARGTVCAKCIWQKANGRSAPPPEAAVQRKQKKAARKPQA